MTSLDAYLTKHFLSADQFAAVCDIPVNELDDLIQQHLIPAPSYTVSESSTISSFVFGEMETKCSRPGRYFHPAHAVWVDAARKMVAASGAQSAGSQLKKQFDQNMQAALTDLNTTTMRLPDCCTDEGSPIADGMSSRIDLMWNHFLKGTFGLCVANPISEAAIARKEILQEKLSLLSNKGTRTEYSPPEAQAVLDLIDAFEEASMPFSPVEYHLSSRKHLVDDIRDLLGSA